MKGFTLHEFIIFLLARHGLIPEERHAYVTAHMQAIRSHPCFKGAAYPRVPLGSSQEKPSAIQTHLLYLWQRGLGSLSAVVWAVLLSVEMFMQTNSSTLCVCVCVCHASHWYSTRVGFRKEWKDNYVSGVSHGRKEKSSQDEVESEK